MKIQVSVTTKVRKMKIESKDFSVPAWKKVVLNKWPTIVEPFCKSTKQYQKRLEEHVHEFSSLQ